LGVSATQNAKALRAAGYIVDWPIRSFADLQTLMKAEVQARTLAHHIPLSHLVISAPWIPTTNLANLTSQNPDREIAVVSRSNIGFLHADPGAIELSQLPHCGQLAGLSGLVAVDLREASFEP
jgi:hypothetical protein